MNSTLQLPVHHDSIFWEHPLFEALTQAQRLWLSQRMQLKTVQAKSIIFKPNEQANQVFFVSCGTVKEGNYPGPVQLADP